LDTTYEQYLFLSYQNMYFKYGEYGDKKVKLNFLKY